MRGAERVIVDGVETYRLLDPEVKVDNWNRWRVMVHDPVSGSSGQFTATEVARSRWKRRAIAIGHRWRACGAPHADVFVQEIRR